MFILTRHEFFAKRKTSPATYLEIFDDQRESCAKQHDLPILRQVTQQLFHDRSEFGRE